VSVQSRREFKRFRNYMDRRLEESFHPETQDKEQEESQNSRKHDKRRRNRPNRHIA